MSSTRQAAEARIAAVPAQRLPATAEQIERREVIRTVRKNNRRIPAVAAVALVVGIGIGVPIGIATASTPKSNVPVTPSSDDLGQLLSPVRSGPAAQPPARNQLDLIRRTLTP